jgi:hypothetical protein
MAIGELQLSPEEFWKLTDGELSAKVYGHLVNRDLRSADFRNLFTLSINQNRKKNAPAKNPQDVWRLNMIDGAAIDIDERLDMYKKFGKNWK